MLESARKIAVQGWMTGPAVSSVMKALNTAGNALFVGGCVRNAMLGLKDIGDIDIACDLVPEDVIKALDAAKIKHVPTGIEHGTVTAVLDGQGFEITSLRKDVETDGRRAVVSFTKDFAQDAQRRDFTMNTLLADAQGNIYDPTGRGLEDIEARRIIFVGEAEQRIREDYLRILRFFRFHALYGSGEPDAQALAACEKYADQIKTLSRERITQEFLKIISAEEPVPILSLMFDHGVLAEFKPGAGDLQLLEWLCGFQSRYGLRFVASRILVLAGLDMKRVQAMEARLLLPKVFVKDMQAITAVLGMADLKTEVAVKEAVYRHGRVPTAQALMIELAQDRVINNEAPQALEIIQNWDVPNFPVSGDDLIKTGMSPGPDMGQALNALEEQWIAAGFPATFKVF